MLNTYCRRCHAAILSNAHFCPMCGLSRPNADNLTELEKRSLEVTPVIPERFEKMANCVSPTKTFCGQIFTLYSAYLKDSKSSSIHKAALAICFLSLLFILIPGIKSLLIFTRFFQMLLIFSVAYLIYDYFLFFKSARLNFIYSRLNTQGGTSPYSVHFKVETVLQNSLKGLQSILYAFYEKPWEEIAKSSDASKEGESFVLATKAVTSKILKFAGISLETITLLWRNNVYAITSYPKLSYDEKITHLKLKLTEAKAIILRYCWLRQLEFAHEFLEAHINGTSGRTTDEDRNYVIEGMQLGLTGPLTEPYIGSLETVPYELPFVMRYFWHQQLQPNSFPENDIMAQYPETAEFFESIQQVRNLITKLEEQKLINMATSAVKDDYKFESEITSEAGQIKRFQLYSDYLDIPKFQTNDAELLKMVDRLNAEIKVTSN